MEQKEYKEYNSLLIRTLDNCYPNYLKKKIIKILANEGLVINSKKKSNKVDPSLIDVSEIDDVNKKLAHILNFGADQNIFKYIEAFEFDKSYRYSTLFKTTSFNEEKFAHLIEEGKLILFRRESSMHDLVDETNIVPTVKITDSEVFIKFPYMLIPKYIDSNLEPIKYVVLCRFDSNFETVEFRFDKAPQGYQSTKDFYTEMINKTIANLSYYFDAKLDNFDFKGIIEYIRVKEVDNITICAMELHRNGSKAYLDSMSNEDMIIPILGELKNFIVENKDLLNTNETTKKIKYKLDDFIENIEVTSDLPSVKIAWDANGAKVGIKHNYKGEDYSLFMHYNELIDSKEMMDDVREFFIEYNGKLTEEIQPITL